ncbi:uncharacterized protein ARMOST_19787 [Armillaria ostoyae]|uniref:Uncharacterized protein n=1 Tax=Armillaria ostoyae TaxID=47428 RepID=A0A284S5I8_ARMOS|nr:uncharacterized protein ARMOST_19787 [Armillaria ostoyae]
MRYFVPSDVAVVQERNEFLDWKIASWRDHDGQRNTGDTALGEALKAYTLQQANIQEALQERFRRLWETPLEDIMLEEEPTGAEQEFDLENDDGSDGEDTLDAALTDHEETDDEL